MKYIQIRHWDYWYGVYGVYGVGPAENTKVNEVEFSITNDLEGDELFFHFDLYNVAALKNEIEENEFMEEDSPEYPAFMEKCRDLISGEIEYFIGGLYYRDYTPGIEECNRDFGSGETILDIKSPQAAPYYAVVFIGESRSLEPDILLEWIRKLSQIFFKEQTEYQIADMPTVEETEKSMQADLGTQTDLGTGRHF